MKPLRFNNQIPQGDSASLYKYFKEISKVSMISQEDEVRLAKKIKQGDENALRQLVEANLRFVVSVAKQYQNQGLSLDDLINEGNLGLMEAAKRFDETLGHKFISYAIWWIRQSISQALGEQSRVVKIPLGRISLLRRVNRAKASLEQQLEREPSIDELAHELEMTSGEVSDIMKNGTNHLSMDAPFSKGEESSLLDIIADESEPDPDTKLLKESEQEEVTIALSSLTDKEANILKLYFGLLGEKSLTLEEIGGRLGFTRERVRQIKTIAIHRLRYTSRSGLFLS